MEPVFVPEMVPLKSPHNVDFMVPLKPPDFNFDITNNFTWNIEIIVEPIKEDLKESSYPNGTQPKGTIMFKVSNQFSTEWRKSILIRWTKAAIRVVNGKKSMTTLPKSQSTKVRL